MKSLRTYLSIVLSAMVAAIALIPTGTVSVAGAACPSGQRQAYVTFHASLRWDYYIETYAGGGQPTQRGRQNIYSGPSGKAQFNFCVKKATSWSIKSANDVHAWAYVNINSDLSANGTGWMLRPGKVNATSITLEPTQCRKSGLFGLFKEIIGLPVPGLAYVLSVGKYLAGKLLPSDGTKCEAFATNTVTIHFASNGDTWANGFTRTYYDKVRNDFWCTGANQQCYEVQEWKWTITAP